MNSPVDTIKERLSITDVISSYLTIEASGKNYKARCPFHNEKTPSFFISSERGTYYCFGCGAKGDIFSFVEKFEGTDFLGALKLLAARAGVSLSSGIGRESHDKKEIWYEILEEATVFFETIFAKHPEPRAYLSERGVTDATIASFRIGYVEDKWRSVSDYLTNKGYKKEDLEAVGLIKIKEDGYYDRFRGRIMFPITDSSGRVIAFSGRIFGLPGQTSKSEIAEARLPESFGQAKYLNSPDTPLFNKSNVLFGIDKAKSSIRTRGYSIIVEGQMDLILSHQIGLTNTVAVSGTALADTIGDSESKINNLGLIRRLSPNVIFAYDGDEAGMRAASRSAMIALSLDMQVKIAVMPEGKDPADTIFENPEAWKDIVKHSVNIVSFHIDRICKATQDMRTRGKKIRDIVFPFLTMVKSAIERSAYLTEIYQKTGIAESALIEDFETYERVHPARAVEGKDPQMQNVQSRRDRLEERFFGTMFWLESMEEIPQEVEELKNLFKQSVGEEIFKNMREIHVPFAERLALEAEMWYGSKIEAVARELTEVLLNLEEEILNDRKLSLKPLDTKENIKTNRRH